MNGNAISSFFIETQLKSKCFLLIICVIACTPLTRVVKEKLDAKLTGDGGIAVVWRFIRFAVVPILLLLLSTAALVGDSYNPFIYFQF